MLLLLSLLTLMYLLCAALLTLYGVGALALLVIGLHRREPPPSPTPHEWPPIAVQLPVYNEPRVVERVIAAAAALDYPRDRLLIQVLDDSSDRTHRLAARAVARWKARGVRIEHVRRANRDGFKAGALAYGLTRLPPSIAYTAIFDADFVPLPDFLKRALPHLIADPDAAAVQTRWTHLNADQNALTRAQALALDAHFAIEQPARAGHGLLLNFSGTGGIWRVSAIQDAGGWDGSVLTEDLDLSYRAQLAGWRLLYNSSIAAPGELPPTFAAYRVQQARWAAGGTQCLVRWFPAIWRSPRLTIVQRVFATLHLAQYLPHPLMITLLLLAPLLMAAGALEGTPLGVFGLVSIGLPAIYVVSQRRLYKDWPRRLLAFPFVLAIGTGMAWSNTRAIVGAIAGRRRAFERTPKFGGRRAIQQPARVAWRGEAALSLYALAGMLAAFRFAPSLVPFFAVYALSFGWIAAGSLHEARLPATPSRRTPASVHRAVPPIGRDVYPVTRRSRFSPSAAAIEAATGD